MAGISYPEDSDLRRLVRFAADSGMIWLDEQRMVLLHGAALAALRKELISSIGYEQARRILTRMGFASGLRDAELARKIRGQENPYNAFVVGPQLHMLEGCVKVNPVQLDIDLKNGHFFGEFIWEHSWEAEAHELEFGQTTDPVCWMQIGYASGYSSAFMGRFILFREVECAATGCSHCRIIGKPAEQWPDAAELTPYFEEDAIVGRLLELREQVEAMRQSLSEPHSVPSLIGASAGFAMPTT